MLRHPLVALTAGLALVAGCSSSPPKPPPIVASSPTPAGNPPPLMVQIEDDQLSRPMYGIQGAYAIFEYLTEGDITRFTVVYTKPPAATRIEPVRSARLVTLRLVRAYGGVLVYSGASNRVQGDIDKQQLNAVNEFSDGGKYFSRDKDRQAPYNLITSGDQLRQAQDKFASKKVKYTLPAPAEPAAGGEAVPTFQFQMTRTHHVAYAYDAGSKTYTYKDDIGTLTDEAEGKGKALAITSAVLIQVAHHDAGYSEDVLGESGIDFDLQGSGPADVYMRGMHYKANWTIADGQPLTLTGADGKPLPLPAGLTMYELVDPGLAVGP